MKVNTITQAEIEAYRTNGSIAEQMPVRFENGFAVLAILFGCEQCGSDIPAMHVRGTVKPFNKHLTIIEATGVCETCKLMTRFLYRVSDSRTIQYHNGVSWTETSLEDKTVLAQAQRWFLSISERILPWALVLTAALLLLAWIRRALR